MGRRPLNVTGLAWRLWAWTNNYTMRLLSKFIKEVLKCAMSMGLYNHVTNYTLWSVF